MGDFSKDIASSFSSSKIKAMLNIVYTANWVSNKQITFFKTYDLSPQQYNILRILRGAGEPLKVQTIKARMVERTPNVTRLTDKLLEKQLIERHQCPNDRRVVHITITKLGLNILNEIPDTLNNDIMKNLTEKEALLLSDLLDKLR